MWMIAALALTIIVFFAVSGLAAYSILRDSAEFVQMFESDPFWAR